jgi:hypothetical protein
MTAGRWGTCLFEVVQRAAVLIGAIEFGHVFIAPAGGTTSSATSHFVKADDDVRPVSRSSTIYHWWLPTAVAAKSFARSPNRSGRRRP